MRRGCIRAPAGMVCMALRAWLVGGMQRHASLNALPTAAALTRTKAGAKAGAKLHLAAVAAGCCARCQHATWCATCRGPALLPPCSVLPLAVRLTAQRRLGPWRSCLTAAHRSRCSISGVVPATCPCRKPARMHCCCCMPAHSTHSLNCPAFRHTQHCTALLAATHPSELTDRRLIPFACTFSAPAVKRSFHRPCPSAADLWRALYGLDHCRRNKNEQ